MMNVIVCVKEVPDPNAPADKFSVVDGKVVPSVDTPRVVSVFDENAVEAAVQIKEKLGAKVTAVSIGAPSAEAIIRRSIAMGSDTGVLVSDPTVEDSDPFSIAYVISKVLEKIGSVDLVLLGQESADTNFGITGPILAELLGIPCVLFARKILFKEGRILVERPSEEGSQVVECPPPVLITVSNEVNQPRYPSVMKFMEARRRPVTKWSATDLGLDSARIGPAAAKCQTVSASIPKQQVECQVISAPTSVAAGAELAERLLRDHVL